MAVSFINIMQQMTGESIICVVHWSFLGHRNLAVEQELSHIRGKTALYEEFIKAVKAYTSFVSTCGRLLLWMSEN